jgi:hypothetical protein
MTFAQLEPSAQAPWTSTTLTSFEDITVLLLPRTSKRLSGKLRRF